MPDKTFDFSPLFPAFVPGKAIASTQKPPSCQPFPLPAHLASVLAFFQKTCLFPPKTGHPVFTCTHAVFRPFSVHALATNRPNSAKPRQIHADETACFGLFFSPLSHAAQNSKSVCGKPHEGSNPSRCAKKVLESSGFQGFFLLPDPYFDPYRKWGKLFSLICELFHPDTLWINSSIRSADC